MSILLWLIFGGLAGWIASLITSTGEHGGIIYDVAVGIIGAIIGGTLAGFVGSGGITGFNLTSLTTAVLGAVLLLFLVREFKRP